MPNRTISRDRYDKLIGELAKAAGINPSDVNFISCEPTSYRITALDGSSFINYGDEVTRTVYVKSSE